MPQTGPKTPAGKARSSRNAVRHGIRSEVAVIDQVEDPKDWERHRDGILQSLQPESHLEKVLAEHIAWALWKLFRVAYYQAIHTRHSIDSAEKDLRIAAAYREGTLAAGIYPEVEEDRVKRAELMRILPDDDTLNKITRYEAHLHRQYIQTLHELEAIQARRRGERTPLARLDITGSPA